MGGARRWLRDMGSDWEGEVITDYKIKYKNVWNLCHWPLIKYKVLRQLYFSLSNNFSGLLLCSTKFLFCSVSQSCLYSLQPKTNSWFNACGRKYLMVPQWREPSRKMLRIQRHVLAVKMVSGDTEEGTRRGHLAEDRWGKGIRWTRGGGAPTDATIFWQLGYTLVHFRNFVFLH